MVARPSRARALGLTTAAVYAYDILDAYLAPRDDVIYQTARLSPAVHISSTAKLAALRWSY